MLPGRKREIRCVGWKKKPTKVSDLGRIMESLGRVLSLREGFLFGPLPIFPHFLSPFDRTRARIISVHHIGKGCDGGRGWGGEEVWAEMSICGKKCPKGLLWCLWKYFFLEPVWGIMKGFISFCNTAKSTGRLWLKWRCKGLARWIFVLIFCLDRKMYYFYPAIK